jgi:catechol 2,3-dioxygenase-like lactoylglutathione lyase family enzyme
MDTDNPANAIANLSRPAGLPFRIGKIGHIALYVSDIERSAKFYTQVLGFSISDVYDDARMPGGAVFLRLNADHHGVALFKASDANPAGARRGFSRPRAFAQPWRSHRLRRPPARRRADSRGVPRPRWPPPRNLLGHRSDRQRRPGQAGSGVEGRPEPGGRHSGSSHRPGHHVRRSVVAAQLSPILPPDNFCGN